MYDGRSKKTQKAKCNIQWKTLNHASK